MPACGGRAGANAVYLGLDEFNARRNAGNFTVESLAIACEYAHLRDVKIYVTMNVEVLPTELDRALKMAQDAYLAGADALIEEIAELTEVAAAFGMDVETFAHGALCVCYSGQCLMSSMIGGRSANRGLCAQACRLPYELRSTRSDEALPAAGEHLLSAIRN